MLLFDPIDLNTLDILFMHYVTPALYNIARLQKAAMITSHRL